MKLTRCIIAVCSLTLLAASSTTFASIPPPPGFWYEVGDAGQNGPAAAQVTLGSGDLVDISGVLSNGNDVDVYLISITSYQNFSAQATGGLDSMLWLFKADGTGQVMNDDYGGFNARLTNQGVFSNGLYYLGISRFNNHPQDVANNNNFGSTPWPGPDTNQIMPNASAGAYDHWTGSSGAGGGYKILLTGGGYSPAPGALALLCMAGVVAMRRRRT